jgi:hypothetical protein
MTAPTTPQNHSGLMEWLSSPEIGVALLVDVGSVVLREGDARTTRVIVERVVATILKFSQV